MCTEKNTPLLAHLCHQARQRRQQQLLQQQQQAACVTADDTLDGGFSYLPDGNEGKGGNLKTITTCEPSTEVSISSIIHTPAQRHGVYVNTCKGMRQKSV